MDDVDLMLPSVAKRTKVKIMRAVKQISYSALALSLCLVSAHADVITASYSGTVTASQNSVSIGDTVTGTLTYDTASNFLSIDGLCCSFGSYSQSSSVVAGLADFYGQQTYATRLFHATTSDELTLFGSFTAMSVADFLKSPPPFTGGVISYRVLTSNSTFSYEADLDSFNGVGPVSIPIPEPASFAFLGLGMGIVALIRRKRADAGAFWAWLKPGSHARPV